MKNTDWRSGDLEDGRRFMEVEVITQLIYNPNAYSRGAFHRLKSDFFDLKPDQYIFKTIQFLSDNNRDVNVISIINAQNEAEIPEDYRISKENLLDHYPDNKERFSTQKLKGYAYDMVHINLRDNFYGMLTQANKNLKKGVSSEDLLSPIETFVTDYRKRLNAGDTKTIEQIIQNFEYEMRKADEAGDGQFSGIETIDSQIGRTSPGELIIIAARPSVGKSMFAMTCFEHMTKFKRCIFHSLETTSENNLGYLIANKGGFSYTEMQKKKLDLDSEQYKETIRLIRDNKNIILKDSTGVNVNDIKAECIDAQENGGLDALFIDHGVLLKHNLNGNNSNEASAIGASSAALKSLAKDLGITVILLYQLNRNLEGEKIGKPRKSHLRGSGQLEEDADKILMLWRPSLYVKHIESELCELEYHFSDDEWENLGIVCVEKNRHGKCYMQIKMTFNPDRARFQDFGELKGLTPMSKFDAPF